MPVRSLSSSVLKWPTKSDVTRAVTNWLHELSEAGRIVRGGYFGSYARGDAGVGSDIDIVVTVAEHDLPFERRAAQFDTTGLPVPADLLVYTQSELDDLLADSSRFAHVLRDETVWLA